MKTIPSVPALHLPEPVHRRQCLLGDVRCGCHALRHSAQGALSVPPIRVRLRVVGFRGVQLCSAAASLDLSGGGPGQARDLSDDQAPLMAKVTCLRWPRATPAALTSCPGSCFNLGLNCVKAL